MGVWADGTVSGIFQLGRRSLNYEPTMKRNKQREKKSKEKH